MKYNIYKMFGEVDRVRFDAVVKSLKAKGYNLTSLLEAVEKILDTKKGNGG